MRPFESISQVKDAIVAYLRLDVKITLDLKNQAVASGAVGKR